MLFWSFEGSEFYIWVSKVYKKKNPCTQNEIDKNSPAPPKTQEIRARAEHESISEHPRPKSEGEH